MFSAKSSSRRGFRRSASDLVLAFSFATVLVAPLRLRVSQTSLLWRFLPDQLLRRSMPDPLLERSLLNPLLDVVFVD